jgi:hypothetical protein
MRKDGMYQSRDVASSCHGSGSVKHRSEIKREQIEKAR